MKLKMIVEILYLEEERKKEKEKAMYKAIVSAELED